jgi:vacuolar-type H+-ATPase subunit D/Vma8
MIRKIEDMLKDAENGLSMEFRQAISAAKNQFE